MADFPTTQPPSISEIEAYIRFWLGNLPTSSISSADMQVLIAMNIGKYGTDNCKITYYSTLDVLRWLIRTEAQGSAGTGGGALIKEREKEGDVEIERQYSTASTGETTGWDKVLEDLLASPNTIGCNPIDETVEGQASGSVIIGGADVNGYEGSLRTRNSFDEARYNYRYQELSPWRPRR